MQKCIIVDSMQQRKFKVHTLFRFEAVDSGTKTAREWATYAKCALLKYALRARLGMRPGPNQAVKQITEISK